MGELVLVTGISGFIAKQVALQLLQQGYAVRGTVRSLARVDEVRETLAAHGADVTDLTFVEADLTADAGWGEAAAGCAFVQHIASPFPIEQPRDREALVPQARQGTLRVLNAARTADVRRVVLTSSTVAMMYRPNRPSPMAVTEHSWTDLEWDQLTAYMVSKTRAEQAAWSWADEQGWNDRLAVVNPGFVLGPALDAQIGTSLEVIRLIMDGAYPALPPMYFPLVDVRDLATLHLRAMTLPAATGRRLIGAGETVSMVEMAEWLSLDFPAYASKIPRRKMPAFAVRLLAKFDRRMGTILPDLVGTPVAENDYVTELTGLEFRPARDSVRAAAQSLIDYGVV